MIRVTILITGLLLASATFGTPSYAEKKGPSQQLLRQIESRLVYWNVGEVEYDKLTSAQASALFLKLNNAPSRFSGRAHIFRQELKTILRWDGSESRYSLHKSN